MYLEGVCIVNVFFPQENLLTCSRKLGVERFNALPLWTTECKFIQSCSLRSNLMVVSIQLFLYLFMKVEEALLQHEALLDYGYDTYVSWKDIFITNYQ